MKKAIKILSAKEIKEALKRNPGWEKRGNKIKKEFKFKDFLDLLYFINKLAPFFERNDHHPDMHIYYNKVLFELTRYDIGEKITNLDFVVAGRIDEVYKNN